MSRIPFNDSSVSKLLGAMATQNQTQGEGMKIKLDPYQSTNLIELHLPQIKENPKRTNFQQRLREASESSEYFHALCRMFMKTRHQNVPGDHTVQETARHGHFWSKLDKSSSKGIVKRSRRQTVCTAVGQL
jgi:hypothetical protein